MSINIKTLLKSEIERLISSGQKEAIRLDDCPLDGDALNCSECAYGCDYIYAGGECISRMSDESKWRQISTKKPMYSGTNDEIKSMPVITLDGGEEIVVAVVWKDMSKSNVCGVDFKSKDAEEDVYLLSCVVEAIRSFS